MKKHLENKDLDTLVGRTITRVLAFDASPDHEWEHHETFWLWLDDGRAFEFSSYGYDADGATFSELDLIDIERCAHCGEPHPDTDIFVVEYESPYNTERGLTKGQRYTYCTDGMHIAWKDAAPAPLVA